MALWQSKCKRCCRTGCGREPCCSRRCGWESATAGTASTPGSQRFSRNGSASLPYTAAGYPVALFPLSARPCAYSTRGRQDVELCFADSSRDSCLYQSAVLVALANLPGNLLSLALVGRVGRSTLMASSLAISAAAALAAWSSPALPSPSLERRQNRKQLDLKC